MATNKNSKKSLEYRSSKGKLSNKEMETLVEQVRIRREKCRNIRAGLISTKGTADIYETVVNCRI